MKKIAVIGLGYVGLTQALVFSKSIAVSGFDNDEKKILALEKQQYLTLESRNWVHKVGKENLNFSVKHVDSLLETSFDIYFICLPTDYLAETKKMNVTSIEKVVKSIVSVYPTASIVIKSTVPVGFTKSLSEKYPQANICIIPEFLREGTAILDFERPDRIVIGGDLEKWYPLEQLYLSVIQKKNVPILYMSEEEAEAVKLFSNAYLAMRVAFFNELDEFSQQKNLRCNKIIQGISHDKRIGDYYNTPSFGFGGYCLPKDTRALVSLIDKQTSKLIPAIIASNEQRAINIALKILETKPSVIGVYRLTMKKASDNFRESPSIKIINCIKSISPKQEIQIFEPLLDTDLFNGMKVVQSFQSFQQTSEIIVANYYDEDLKEVVGKTFTRDRFLEELICEEEKI
ncbi:nucleotide sugar dehydrogenase [Listeria sp. PSOL-1]|uniref:nucleotide sugar dehydrogenase n=1 Tax=Listeria sp. PSOL-1 TaxID=1844999 RepID=UPI0013D4BF5B|nr:nucleotide sugar dehydrogenase [Listeria sp. PSOL-1]